jgi:hypothetical protein
MSNHDRSRTEETDGSDRVPDLKRLRCEPWLEPALFQRERNGALLGVHAIVCFKNRLTPPTLSETGFFTN